MPDPQRGRGIVRPIEKHCESLLRNAAKINKAGVTFASPVKNSPPPSDGASCQNSLSLVMAATKSLTVGLCPRRNCWPLYQVRLSNCPVQDRQMIRRVHASAVGSASALTSAFYQLAHMYADPLQCQIHRIAK